MTFVDCNGKEWPRWVCLRCGNKSDDSIERVGLAGCPSCLDPMKLNQARILRNHWGMDPDERIASVDLNGRQIFIARAVATEDRP